MIERVSLNGLKFFYYVAEYGSVTIAAQKLFVTQSAVSKQIKNLEETLGVLLFARVNKTLQLTAKGQVLFASCQQVFSQLDRCLTDVSQPQNNSKQLVLSCEPTISMKWLIPRLAKFNALNPGFDIVLLTAGGAVDFQAQGIDIALRRNDFAWGNDIFHEKVIEESMVVVRRPQATADKTLIISTSRPDFWQCIHQSDLVDKTLRSYDISRLEHFYLCIEACLAGLGTTIVSAFTVEQELTHRLLQVVQSPFTDGSAYHLLSATPFCDDDRKLVFKEWHQQEMIDSQKHLAALL